MSIYARLKDILEEKTEEAWKVSFSEIERLIGAKLPTSAFKYPGWWSNNPSNNAMTKIWLEAGWRTEKVDIAGQTVVFRRGEKPLIIERRGFRDRQRPWEGPPESWPRLETKSIGSFADNVSGARRRESSLGASDSVAGADDMFDPEQLSERAEAALGRPPRFEDFFGALKGMVTPGADLAACRDTEWGALREQ